MPLLSSTLVRDALRRTRSMQWTSRRGRRVLNAQIGAALLSGLLLTVLNCAAYLGPFLSTGALRFWECPLFSVWNITYPWFDWTYGQYLLGLTFLLTLAASGFTVVLSQFSGGYAPQGHSLDCGAVLGRGALDHGWGGVVFQPTQPA